MHLEEQFHVNIWMGILDNYVIKPFFFSKDINITAETYSIFLIKTLPYLLEDVPLAVIPNIIFQQDDHPAHSSLLTRTIFNRKFSNRWIGIHHSARMAPGSPVINRPIEFSLKNYH